MLTNFLYSVNDYRVWVVLGVKDGCVGGFVLYFDVYKHVHIINTFPTVGVGGGGQKHRKVPKKGHFCTPVSAGVLYELKFCRPNTLYISVRKRCQNGTKYPPQGGVYTGGGRCLFWGVF